ncbi:MAG: hypothetical protein JW955_05360, partial [Sedimentisphaerales bacterium]|nr:hypothetical protein [Sedimentisphaerales bacterium]
MTTEAQITANRINAQKSTGPRTAEGKAIVAQNAIKHGLLSRRAVIKDEDPAEFEGYRAAMIESLRPRDAAEESVVQRIVNLSWRLKRAERMQDEALNFLLEADARECQTRHLRASGDPSGADELTFGRVIAREFSSGRTLEKLMTYERWIENSLYRSFN